MAGEPGGIEDVREHEDEARAREAAAEGRRAERERESEVPPSAEPGARDRDEGDVVPAEADEERTGVMRPPEGSGPG
jgi:hypothetical protein